MTSLRADRLTGDLKNSLRPRYLLTGEEPLLVQELRDEIRAAARQAGVAEWLLFAVERGFDWNDLAAEAESMSLFAERRLLDVRFRDVPDANTAKAMNEALARCSDDDVLVVSMGYADRRVQNSAWFKALSGRAAHIAVWPVRPNELPGWIQRRARGLRVNLAPDGAAFLASRVEGNLLAAAQEVTRLSILPAEVPWSAEALADAIGDSARFDAFAAFDAACLGQLERVVRVLSGLRFEGAQVLAVSGAFGWQLRRLAEMVEAGRTAGSINGALAGARLTKPQQRVYEAALKRLLAPGAAPAPVWDWVAGLATIDQQVKGMVAGDPWRSLEAIALAVAGATVANPAADAEFLRRPIAT